MFVVFSWLLRRWGDHMVKFWSFIIDEDSFQILIFHFQGGRGGRIINTASAAGLTTSPPLGDLNTTTYAVAKHAMVSMTRSFLTSDPPVYESDGIKCYALCPGFVETNLVQKALDDRGLTNQELTQKTNMRVMTTKEIGDALVKSLQYDKV